MHGMRVHLIDPAGDVAPYDHALAAALARPGRGGGARDLALRARPGARPGRVRRGRALPPAGHAAGRGRAPAAAGAPLRSPTPRTLLRYRRPRARPTCATGSGCRCPRSTRAARAAPAPRVLTLHNVLRAERLDARLLGRMDAVVVHTRPGPSAWPRCPGCPRSGCT